MTIGVVIVTFNAGRYIAECLAALAAQTLRPRRIILFDNASADSTVEIGRATASLRALPLEIVANPVNIGFAAANNRAVDQLADCEFIATLNPDAFPEPGWLAGLADAAARHPEAASFASRLVAADDESRLDGIGDVFHVSGLAWRLGHHRLVTDVSGADAERPIFSACAAAALYRHADWVSARGFDERFFCYAEDVDLGFRLQLLGKECWYVPGSIARHMGGAASGRRSSFAVYHGHRNLEWTYIKNMPKALLIRYMPLHVLASVASIGWFIATGAGGSIVRAKWDAIRGLRGVLSERTRVQSQKRVSDRALLQRLDRSSLWRRFRDRVGYA